MEKREISSGYEIFLEETKLKSKKFNNKEFSNNFDQIKGKCEHILKDTFAMYHEQDDCEELLEECAKEFAVIAAAKIEQMPKREKGCALLDYNMGLVTFGFPIIMSIPDSAADKFVDYIVADWNKTFQCNISKSTKEVIEGGFKSGWCYITTAVCESQNKSDDCYELNLLRQYRDNYLIKSTPDGEELVKEYYNVAPTIVKRINKREDAVVVYNSIWEEHLQPCISLIEEGDNEACKASYANMVEVLKKEYFN